MSRRSRNRWKPFSGRGSVSEPDFVFGIVDVNVFTGTRWLTTRDKEVELLVRLLYLDLTTGRCELIHL
jgi:hypothetical protein